MSGEGQPKTAFVFAGGGSLGAIQVGMLHALASHGIVADVDLRQRYFWRNNLGDFKSENVRARPIGVGEPMKLMK